MRSFDSFGCENALSAMPYRKAPITEAVIEFRFARPFEKSIVDTAARRLRDEYAFHDPENALNLRLDAATQKSEVETAWQGVKLSSIDRADAIFFRTISFVCSRLAPYTGWEEFSTRAVRAWDVWKRAAGSTEISRVGVRYVNRLDIPLVDNEVVQVEDYLKVNPRSPEELATPLSSYTMQIVRPVGADDCSLLLNSGTLAAPLIGFGALVLDIDIFRETDLPRRDDELWRLLDRIRIHKN